MSTAVIELTGDEAKLLRSLQNVMAKEEQLSAKMLEVGKSGDKAGRDIDRSMTAAGKKSATEINKILRELRKSGPEGRKAASELESHFRSTGKHGRREIGSVVSSLSLLDDEAAKVAKNTIRDFDRVGKSGKRAFGGEAIKSLAAYAAGWVSIQSVIGLTAEALARVRQEQEKALTSLESTADPNRRLLQVSTGAEDFKQLTSTADQLAMDFGISRDEARGLMFSARSEGFEGSAEFIARNSQVLGVQSQATVAGQIPGLFKGENLGGEQAINMTLQAAAASRLNFEELARALPGAAEGGALAGASSEETIGALSVLAGRFKSGDTAADRLKAFTSRVGLDTDAEGRESLAGSGIVDAVTKLQAMNEGQRKDFLGESQEVNAAFVILTEEFAAIQGRIREIEQARDATGAAQSPAAMRRSIAESDPKLKAIREKNRAANRREIANEERNAIEEAKRQARADQTAAGAKNRGESEFGIAAGAMAGEAVRGLGGVLEATGVQTTAETNAQAGAVSRGLAGGRLTQLQQSAAEAIDVVTSQEDRRILSAVNFGAARLGAADSAAAPGTLGQLSRGDVAGFMREATGQAVDFRQVTPEMQAMVTEQVRNAAAANPGRQFADIFGVTSMFGGGAARDAQAIVPAVKMDALLAAMDRANELQAEANAAATATAENTSPANRPTAPPPNYNSGLQPNADATGRTSF